ncbi:HesA/MoeB/ThiF family protein [Nocardia farcinica]|uniref:HesA/MoeB/ThiF family protein n=1 Tax=Nocardia farcinica TaxID=37329 RepID=UPI002453A8D4|nr:ThiF family adenylyltransferase [Nocardia farcinica]
MSHADPVIVLPRNGAQLIATAAASPITTGELKLRRVDAADFYVVHSVEKARGIRQQVDIPAEYRTLNWKTTPHIGQYTAAPADLHRHHLTMLQRPGTIIEFSRFKQLVPMVRHPGPALGLLITHDPNLDPELGEAGAQEFAGWIIQGDDVHAIPLAVEPEVLGLEQLRGLWPLDELAGASVMLVGCGSIGGATADALAAYGIGSLHLVDPDRLLWHNLIRHVLGPDAVGQFKVDALRTRLSARYPNLGLRAHRRDVVVHADLMRALIPTVDLVVCTADGIAARRTVSHLARRAAKPALLACVLDHGGLGEILRLRPTPRFGCLLCSRQHLAELGAMDTEADQELDYGTGHTHQPMTAVAPDLHHIGLLAAKCAVATLLQSGHGDDTQALPGEHAIIGLRPDGPYGPPFDLAHPGQISWHPIPPPRPSCPTCNPTPLQPGTSP